MKSKGILILFISCFYQLSAQRLPDKIFASNINGIKFFQLNNQFSQPIIRLNSTDQLELHFDDLSTYPKNYFYTYELCNADWTPANLSVFDYIKGFNQMRLEQYRVSSFAGMKYVHYQAQLPENNSIPAMSGNYILRVYLDGDTAKTVFTKRMMVVNNIVPIAAQIQVPFDNEISRTHQKLQFSIDTKVLNLMGPQQVKVVTVQNNRWDDAIKDKQPAFIKDNILEYNGEQDFIFQSGKEYRWADLQSFRFQSDRIAKVDRTEEPYTIFLRPDLVRNNLAYVNFADRNGYTEINTSESVNPWWQGDYAWVHFSFVPPGKQSIPGKEVYLIGELTGNQISDTAVMQFSTLEGAYIKNLLLKQGYYSYAYVTKDKKNWEEQSDLTLTEGNYWETENVYNIYVYYRALNGRHDELVGLTTINSRFNR